MGPDPSRRQRDGRRQRTSCGVRLKQILEGVDDEGWRFVAFVRLVPLFPFNLLNYALGLTRIRFLAYASTTLVCMLPGTIAYTVSVRSGRGMGPVKRISHVEARPHKVLSFCW